MIQINYHLLKNFHYYFKKNENLFVINYSNKLKIKELKNHNSNNISKIEDLEELNKNLELQNNEIFEENTKFKA